jgi:hypothetical protein
MKTVLSMGVVAFLAACSGMSPRPQQAEAPQGHWQGFVLRNGLREPVAVELSEASNAWDGRISAGDNSVPLEDVRIIGSNVHFALRGEGIFDGAVAGDTMAGSVSGPLKGSFALTRIEPSETWDPYPNGP